MPFFRSPPSPWKVSSWLGLSLVTGLLVVACAAKPKPQTVVAAPEFSVKDLSGRTVTLASLKGQVVLLDFWATWCPPCRMSVPELEKLHEEYAGKPLKVVGISMDQETDRVPAFVKKARVTYLVALGVSSTVAQDYQVEGLPTFVLIDKEGRVVRRWVGYDQRLPAQWRESINELL